MLEIYQNFHLKLRKIKEKLLIFLALANGNSQIFLWEISRILRDLHEK